MDRKSNTCTWINKICFFSITHSAVISFDDRVTLFGGYGGRGQVNTVATFIGGEWFKIGDLKESRYKHNAIRSGTEVIIVGGYRT